MSLLAPLFLAGLLAVAIPIAVHLTARDRQKSLRFPSLRFLRRLPYREVRRQRLRDPLLFALRTLAVVLLALAFARPFIPTQNATALSPGRDVLIALDMSYSMAYSSAQGSSWQRARDAVRETLGALPADSRVALLTFADEAQLVVPPTRDSALVTTALDDLEPGPGQTAYAPVLRLANDALLDHQTADSSVREVILISDFQAKAWDRQRADQLLPGVRLRTVNVGPVANGEEPANVRLTSVELHDEEQLLRLRLVNDSPNAVQGTVTLNVANETTAAQPVRVAATASQHLSLALPTNQPTDQETAQGMILEFQDGGESDGLATDSRFHLTLAPRPSVPVLLVEKRATPYLRQALELQGEIALDLRTTTPERVRRTDIEVASLIILHDCPLPSGDAGRALADAVAGGAGLWILLGNGSGDLPEEGWLGIGWSATVDRLSAHGVHFNAADTSHPIFEIFAAEGSGNVSGPRIDRYREIEIATGDHVTDDVNVVARYTDGAVAIVEKKHGEGRVLVWGSPLDNLWSNLPIQAIFLPLVHQTSRYLADISVQPHSWQIGDRLSTATVRSALNDDNSNADVIRVTTPAGQILELTEESPPIPLGEAGFYVARSTQASYPFAVNVDQTESNLTALDEPAFIAASTTQADAETASPTQRSRTADTEKQSFWRPLILLAAVALIAEHLLSWRPSK